MDDRSQDAVPSLGRCVQQSHSAEFLVKYLRKLFWTKESLRMEAPVGSLIVA